MSYISTNIQGGLGNQLFQIANLLIYYNKINEKNRFSCTCKTINK